MSRGYSSPSVEIKESEILPNYSPAVLTEFGVIGLATKGPLGPTKVSSVYQLHDTFGFPYIGVLNGVTIYSEAIASAERILQYSQEVIFCRLQPEKAELDKLKVTGSINFTVDNNDFTVRALTIKQDSNKGDPVTYTLKIKQLSAYGDLVETVLFTRIAKENIVAALESTSYFKDVSLGEGFPGFDGEALEKTFAVTADPLVLVGDNSEFEYYENKDTVDVSVLIAPIGNYLEAKNPDKISWVDKQDLYDKLNGLLVSVVNSRNDCMTVLEYPKSIPYTDFVSMFSGPQYVGYDVSQACTCYPPITYKNVYSNVIMELSSSAIMTRQMAYTDSIKACWIAPAGFSENKGVVSDAIDTTQVLTKNQRDKLYELRVNPVAKFVGKGICLFGNVTMKANSKYGTQSMYTAINVRRLVNYIKKILTNISLNTIFDPNISATWRAWKNQVEPELRAIQDGLGIDGYVVTMDETTVTDEDIANGRAPGSVYILPVRAVEYIPIDFVLTQDSVVFSSGEGVE